MKAAVYLHFLPNALPHHDKWLKAHCPAELPGDLSSSLFMLASPILFITRATRFSSTASSDDGVLPKSGSLRLKKEG
ncbi:hypothetical protein [Erwinia tracheiphila]|uniref:hypothetical protein n=1 Tax=Erwinia tracheiphila TaxID=65700 RepID=UPI001F1CCBA0|nr:hypothetical protein [Erwinia tracheiphila]